MQTNKLFSLVFNILVGISLSFIAYTFFLSGHYTPSFRELSFFDQLPTIYNSIFGILIAGFFFSAIIVYPFIQNIIQSIKSNQKTTKTNYTPEITKGTISSIVTGKDTIEITVKYNNITKIFFYPVGTIETKIFTGKNINVHYNQNDFEESYLDFYSIHDSTKEKEPLSTNASIKVIEINPKFNIQVNLFEIIGELYNDQYNGQKTSIKQVLSSSEASEFIPGRIFPCTITKSNDELTISITSN